MIRHRSKPLATLRRRNAKVGRRSSQRRSGIPAGQTNLTAKERALLPDPDWVTENDADYIIGLHREREPGKRYSLKEVLRVAESQAIHDAGPKALDHDISALAALGAGDRAALLSS